MTAGPAWRVRVAVDADLVELQGVFRRASLSNPGDRAALLAHPEALLLGGEGVAQGRTRVAITRQGRIAGFATTLPVPGGVELEDLFVDPPWMRQGVARLLIEDAVTGARRQGVERLEVDANPHAMAFYRSVGFLPVGTTQTAFGPGVRMHLVLLEPLV